MDPAHSSLFQLVTGGSNLFQLALRFSMHVYYVNIWTTNDTLVLQIWHRILNASIITLLNKSICNMFHCLTTTFKFSLNQERKQTSKHYKYCRFTKNVFTAYFQSFSLNFFNNHAKWRNETQVSKKRFIKKYYRCNKACQFPALRGVSCRSCLKKPGSDNKLCKLTYIFPENMSTTP